MIKCIVGYVVVVVVFGELFLVFMVLRGDVSFVGFVLGIE